ncbi:MAG: DUF58 domain-containing protein [Verrucomicrobia bacterium TMED44]|nr:MAG: DUF58 domain-containing protein [Verrucomicrobia bacterium TMED44]
MNEPDQEFTREILRKVRQIEIKSNRLVSEVLSGSYQSAFKGQGIDFEEVREYQPGDEVRSIDWNVTAKMGAPFVKQYREERELTILLAIDISESTIFGSESRTKRERLAELSALLAISASRNGDKVGLLLFAEEVEIYLPPANGQKNVLRILREILFHRNKTKKTNLNEGLRFINKVMRRRAVVFFLSDFIIPEFSSLEEEDVEVQFYKEISSTKRRHDLICAQIHDPNEISLPKVGFTTFEDAETGERITVDLSNNEFLEEYAELTAKQQKNFSRKLQRRGIDIFKLSTNVEFDKALKEFFHLRKSRRS